MSDRPMHAQVHMLLSREGALGIDATKVKNSRIRHKKADL
jgi:hypothetical protein